MRPAEEQLSAYLDNELASQERAEIERWLEQDPALRETLENLREVRKWIGELPTVEPSSAPKSIVEMLSDQEHTRAFSSVTSATSLKNRFFNAAARKSMLSLAAVGVTLIGTTLWWLSQNETYRLAQSLPPTTNAPDSDKVATPRSTFDPTINQAKPAEALSQKNDAFFASSADTTPPGAMAESPVEPAPMLALSAGKLSEEASVEGDKMVEAFAGGSRGAASELNAASELKGAGELKGVGGLAGGGVGAAPGLRSSPTSGPAASRNSASQALDARSNNQKAIGPQETFLDSKAITCFLIEIAPQSSADNDEAALAKSQVNKMEKVAENDLDKATVSSTAAVIVPVTRATIPDFALDDLFSAIQSNDFPLREVNQMEFTAAVLKAIPETAFAVDTKKDSTRPASENTIPETETIETPTQSQRDLKFKIESGESDLRETTKRRFVLGVTPQTWASIQEYFETRGYRLVISEIAVERRAPALPSNDDSQAKAAPTPEPPGTLTVGADRNSSDRIFILLEGE